MLAAQQALHSGFMAAQARARPQGARAAAQRGCRAPWQSGSWWGRADDADVADGLHADGGDDSAEAAEPLAEDDVRAGPARPQRRREARGAPAHHQHLAARQHRDLAGFLC